MCNAGTWAQVTGGGAGGTVTSVALSRTDDTNVTVAITGSPITTSGTINIALGWTGTLSVSRGGIGVGTLTGIAKGNGTSAFTAAASSDIVGLFTGCSGTLYLGADGACHAEGTGTVTSVATTSPIGGGTITTTGTITCTTCTTNASALTADLPVIGAGGQAAAVGTRSGNTTAYVTTTGTQTSGDCVKIDANGNHVANGSACGSSGGASGASFLAANNQSGTAANWQNFTIMAAIRGEALQAYPTSWKVRMRFTAGSPVIGAMKILRTSSRSTTVIDSTTVQIGGSSTPTLTTPTLVDTDAISLTLDNTHDYWFAIFFTNVGANASVSVSSNGPVNNTAGYAAGDQSGVSTIPSLTVSNSPYLFVTAVF